MSDAPDTIGPYSVIRELGRGGMGVVYLARDPRLDRDVAIKALPAELATSPDRLARFEREAKTLAQLNHPNVAGIYGLEEHEGQRFLILEFVEGELLADRLDRGPLPVEDAIEIAVQIAAGVEAAHDAGVIHRDLKPGNVIITPEDKAVVLDFGLARTDDGNSSTSAPSVLHDAPTLTSPAIQHSPTMPGVILGTAAYMSPEQARGRKVDKRTDIWSFGVVLYEMLAGSSPFVGETISDSIGAILHKQPELDRLPPQTPQRVHRVLERCLERDRTMRLQSIGDARIELMRQDDRQSDSAQTAASLSRRAWPALGLAFVLGAVTIGVVAAWFALRGADVDAVQGRRFEADILPHNGLELARTMGPIRISHDSRWLAFLAFLEGEIERKLVVRNLETGEESILRGPDQPLSPAWMSDGRTLAYISGQRSLEAIDVGGGRPRILANLDAATLAPGAFHPSGRFGFAGMRSQFMLVDPVTGQREQALDPIPEHASDWVIAPSFLPDGDHVIFGNQDDQTAYSGLYLGSLRDGWAERLLPYESSAVFVEPDIVVYWAFGDNGSLHAQRLDLERRELVGAPVQLADSVARRPWPAYGNFDANRDTLVYVANDQIAAKDELWMLDIAAGVEESLGMVGSLWNCAVSPDGTTVAIDRTVEATAGDIVLFDLETRTETPLSRDEANESVPIWGPDSDWVYFFQGQSIVRASPQQPMSAEEVYASNTPAMPIAISPDNSTLLMVHQSHSIEPMLLDLRTGQTRPLAMAHEALTFGRGGGYTTDGSWIIFSSSTDGQWTVWATPADGAGEPIALTRAATAITTVEGDWLYYHTERDLVRRSLTVVDGALEIGEPQRLLDRENTRYFAPMPDGTGVVFVRDDRAHRGGHIRVITNWLPPSLR